MLPPNPRQSQSPAPERIGRYEVLLPIASGGMATVYLARSRGLGGFEREVAIKITHAHLREQTEFAADLIEEAKLAVKIRHPNVVATLDIGDDPYGLFLVMDYVEGDSLAGLLRRGGTDDAPPLPPAFGLRILLDALAGLHAAHELRDDAGALLGLVHRDFSPQNILVGVDGMSRLADFGIAKAASRLGHTATGMLKGKVGYMSPEQARGQPIDRRCDIWAAGVIAWEIFAGRRMHPKDLDELSILLKIVTEPIPLLRTVRPELPEAVEQAVAAAFAPSVDLRWPTAAAFAKALLEGCRSGGIHPAEPAEVGALVQSLAGPKLARRRAHASEVMTLHERKSDLTEMTPSNQRRPPVTVPFPPRITPQANAASDAEPPTVARPPVIPRAVTTTVVMGAPNPPAVPAEVTKTVTVTVSTASLARALGTSRTLATRWVVLAGAAVLGIALLAGAGAGAWASFKSRPPEGEPVAAATAPAAPSSAPSPPPEVAATAVPSSAPAPAAPRLAIAADVAIAAVRVGTRKAPIAAPAREVTVELTGDEAGRALRLEIVSVDGRRATANLDAGSTTATLKFPASAAPAPLAPSPYRRHP